MGVKRIHLQLAAKRRWQNLDDADTARDAKHPWQFNAHQHRWSAQRTNSKFKDLP